MKKEQLFILNDGEFKRLDHIDNVTLEVDAKDDSDGYKRNFNSEPITLDGMITVEDEKGRNVVRLIASGGDRGIYNGMTLAEDGYLGLDNAWL